MLPTLACETRGIEFEVMNKGAICIPDGKIVCSQKPLNLRSATMPIGNWALLTLKVNPDAGTTRDPDDYFDERSAQKRPGCYRRELLQFSRGKAANEAGRAARRIPSENSRAHH